MTSLHKENAAIESRASALSHIVFGNDDDDDDDDDDDEDARVVLHFDFDAFYVACERELNPALRGVPVAVSQYNPYGDLIERSSQDIYDRWVVQADTNAASSLSPPFPVEDSKVVASKDASSSTPATAPAPVTTMVQTLSAQNHSQDTNGSLIAVSYEARAHGVKRSQRGKEACQACPNLNIVQVPVKHGKADLTMYRNASKRVMGVLKEAILGAAQVGETEPNPPCSTVTASPVLIEIASIDEVYMDVTKLANQLVHRVLAESASATATSVTTEINNPTEIKNPTSLWSSLVDVASCCTTIGGIEVLSEAAQATNALGKDELRRGSHVQVLDSQVTIDAGSQAWWNRDVLTHFSHVQLRLACGAFLAAQARAKVQAAFGEGDVFTLSAGISSNKTLAKLASGLKKPNRQTLIYRDPHVLQTLFHPLPLGRIRGLGGKFGDSIAQFLQIETVGQLRHIPYNQLEQVLSQTRNASDATKMARFLHDISRGLCTDPVTPRSKPKSIECSKTFRGALSISARDTAKLGKWMGELCSELQERLQQDEDDYHRYASTLKVAVQFHFQRSFLSKQTRAPRRLDLYPRAAWEMIQTLIEIGKEKFAASNNAGLVDLRITGMGVGGSQFVDRAAGSSSILSAMQKAAEHSPSKAQSSLPSGGGGAMAAKSQSRLASTTKRRSGVQLWLEQSHKQGVQPNGTSAPPSKRANSSCPPVGCVPDTTSNKSTIPLKMIMPTSMDEIDPEVLRALPKELQIAILGDMQQRQNSMKKEKGKRNIENFFQPMGNKKR